jgi:5-methylthioadenosine/S-adenosylhomocysteine deaminase
MEIELLIIPEWIITVDSANQVLRHHAIAVDDNRIVGIMPTSEAEKRYTPRQTVVLAQQAVLPGFVNAHTHVAMALLKGLADDLPLMDWLQGHIWPAEARWADASFVYDGAQLAIAEMIRSGTTCFNDMYFFPEATAQAAEEAGIRACIGLIMIDFPTRWGNNPDDYLQKGLALHDRLQANPLLTTAFAPHAPYTVSDIWRVNSLFPSTCTSTKPRLKSSKRSNKRECVLSHAWKNLVCSTNLSSRFT